MIQLTDQPLDIEKIINKVRSKAAGAINVFIGTVRDTTDGRKVVSLEFEAYIPMALSEMNIISNYVQKQWPALTIAIHHRIGTLSIGDIPVIIAVATPHRKQGFEACAYAIDTLKKTVPIWKKEIFEDGGEWVEAHP